MDPKTILIVDDEQVCLEYLEAILRKNGYRVVATASGRECVELARKEKPQLMILDIQLGDISGTQVALELARDPETSRIPYFFLTGMLSAEEEFKLHNTIGGNFFLTKPCSPQRVMDEVVRRIG